MRARSTWSAKVVVLVVVGLVAGLLSVAEVVLSPGIPAAEAQVPPTMASKAIATTSLADAPIACGGGEVEAKWSNVDFPRVNHEPMHAPTMYAYVYVPAPIPEHTQFTVQGSATIDSGPPGHASRSFWVEVHKVTGTGVNWMLFQRYTAGSQVQNRSNGIDDMSPQLHKLTIHAYTDPEKGDPGNTGTIKVTIPTNLAAPCPPLGDGEACGCSASMPGVGDSQGQAADPVLTRNGTFYEDVTDFDLGGRQPLSLSRRYISSRGVSEEGAGFGPGWTQSWMGSLSTFYDFSGDRRIEFREESGASIMFYKYEGSPGQNGKYRGLPMVTAWVERSGSEYRLYRGGVEFFV